MKRRALRLALSLIALGAMGTAAWVTWSGARQAAASADSFRTIDANGRAAATAITDLRAAQQSYVAAGQGEAFWFARVSSLLGDITAKIDSLRGGVTAPAAASALEDAAAAMQDFVEVDRRARDYTKAHQATLASDLIYSEGFDLTRRAALDVNNAIAVELSRTEAEAGALHRKIAAALAGAGLVALIVLLLLVPLPRVEATATEAVTSPAKADAEPASAVPNPFDDFETLETKSQGPAIDLERVAELCSELARVTDTQALPALLATAAAVLDASGIVVWVADPDRRELMPILVHGYAPELATRIGTLQRDAANVTAAAFRTGLLQTVNGDTISDGAVAAPLVAAGGAVGVMAAEVRHGGEQRPQILAAARVIAAQLATLVGPPAARAKTEAAG
jgi:CHASE3 domain sensor protein